MELLDSRMDGFCVFNPYLGFSVKILKTTEADEVRFDL